METRTVGAVVAEVKNRRFLKKTIPVLHKKENRYNALIERICFLADP
mgnify:CR=1 FL=1